MPTRFFFPDGVAAPVTPPAAGAEWEHVNSGGANYRQKLLTAADTSALATVDYSPDAADDLTDRDAQHRQYVSGGLNAQTISGNVTAQFQALETFNNDNLFLTLVLKVISNDGATTRATLLAITRDTTTEYVTSLTNRNFPSTAVTNYTCVAGDRLLVEVGSGGSITSGAAGVIGHNSSIRWGCNASSGDLPVDTSTTGTTYRPWLEFSTVITFQTTATRGRVSWTEQETPFVPTRGRVSWTECQVPTVPTRGRISWTEVEAPLVATRGRASWTEFQVPSVPTRGRIAWTEHEVPIVPTRGRVAWAEVSIPVVATRGRASWTEFEVPLLTPTRGRLAWTECQIPYVPTRGRLAWALLEPDQQADHYFAWVAPSAEWPTCSSAYTGPGSGAIGPCATPPARHRP